MSINFFPQTQENIKKDYYAFIDESGNEKSLDKWFVVSAFITTNIISNIMLDSIESFQKNFTAIEKITGLTFKDLRRHDRKMQLISMLNRNKYFSIHAIFHIPSIRNNWMQKYPNMYFTALLYLLERLSWATMQFKRRKVHVLISKRDEINEKNLNNFLKDTIDTKGYSTIYKDKIGNIKIIPLTNQPKLLLADYTASIMASCLEKRGNVPYNNNCYFDEFLKGRLYCSNFPDCECVWNNGCKCTPKKRNLIGYGDILDEGSHDYIP